jgi:GT2 family glycosyltransferase
MPLRLSVIICTKNRPADLRITLQSIGQQTRLPECLVFIDDGDTEKNREILREWESIPTIQVLYIHPEPRNSGLPQARNLGIDLVPATTDIILFLDDDVTLEPTYLECILDIFKKNPDAEGVSGFIRSPYHHRSLPVKLMLFVTGCILPSLVPVSLFSPRVTFTAEALYPLFRKPHTETVPAQWLSGCNMAFRSGVFKNGAAFDENLTRYALGEDMIFSYGLSCNGRKLLLSCNALLIHRVSGENHTPPFWKLVMTFGYRNYIISRVVQNRIFGSFWYTVFCIQYILSSGILSIWRGTGPGHVKEVIRAYSVTREFMQEIESGNLERFNAFLYTLQ